MFKYTDLPAFAAKYHRGDRTAAVEALMRNGPNVKYVPNNAYADAKLIIAWWVAALARRLPSGMAVYAVSPGGATDTKVVRNAGPLLKYLFIPIVNLIPGMNQTPETAARRYLQASEFGTDVSGQFFASAQGKFSGPIEAQRHPHLHDRASQEAAWQAVVKVSGVDFVFRTTLKRGVLKERRSRRTAVSSAGDSGAMVVHGSYGILNNSSKSLTAARLLSYQTVQIASNNSQGEYT